MSLAKVSQIRERKQEIGYIYLPEACLSNCLRFMHFNSSTNFTNQRLSVFMRV